METDTWNRYYRRDSLAQRERWVEKVSEIDRKRNRKKNRERDKKRFEACLATMELDGRTW